MILILYNKVLEQKTMTIVYNNLYHCAQWTFTEQIIQHNDPSNKDMWCWKQVKKPTVHWVCTSPAEAIRDSRILSHVSPTCMPKSKSILMFCSFSTYSLLTSHCDPISESCSTIRNVTLFLTVFRSHSIEIKGKATLVNWSLVLRCRCRSNSIRLDF